MLVFAIFCATKSVVRVLQRIVEKLLDLFLGGPTRDVAHVQSGDGRSHVLMSTRERDPGERRKSMSIERWRRIARRTSLIVTTSMRDH